MPFQVSAGSSYFWVVVALVWLVCSWTLYRTLADMPVYKRTSFYSRTLPWRVTIVLGGLLTLCVGAAFLFVVGGGMFVLALLAEAYDHVVWFFTKGPATPYVTSTRERFRRFASNTPVRS
jgi:hypothetical protein